MLRGSEGRVEAYLGKAGTSPHAASHSVNRRSNSGGSNTGGVYSLQGRSRIARWAQPVCGIQPVHIESVQVVVVRIMSGTSNGNIVFGFCFLTIAAFLGGFVATVGDIYKEGGLSSFYRGFGAALMVILGNATPFAIKKSS